MVRPPGRMSSHPTDLFTHLSPTGRFLKPPVLPAPPSLLSPTLERVAGHTRDFACSLLYACMSGVALSRLCIRHTRPRRLKGLNRPSLLNT